MKRYRRWCIRQASQANCNPVLGILAVLVVVGISCYIYRETIIKTVEVALLACGAVAAVVAVTALTVSTVRWYRKRAREAAAAIPASEPQDVPATDANVKTISDEADWLASGVELAFGPDGSLKAKGAPE